MARIIVMRGKTHPALEPTADVLMDELVSRRALDSDPSAEALLRRLGRAISGLPAREEQEPTV